MFRFLCVFIAILFHSTFAWVYQPPDAFRNINGWDYVLGTQWDQQQKHQEWQNSLSTKPLDGTRRYMPTPEGMPYYHNYDCSSSFFCKPYRPYEKPCVYKNGICR